MQKFKISRFFKRFCENKKYSLQSFKFNKMTNLIIE